MENFTLKGPRLTFNSQEIRHKHWVSCDSIYKKNADGSFWPITCLQSVPHNGTEYYMPIDTPIVEEKKFLVFYFDFLYSLDAFRFVDLFWEKDDLIKIVFDPTKVTYDYLVILNSLLRNCHTYWHVPYLFHKFSSWDLDVDPLKLLVLSHRVPFVDDHHGWTPKDFPLADGKTIPTKLHGHGHSIFSGCMTFELASPEIKLVNPFDSCNSSTSKFSTRKRMHREGYEYFLHPSTPYIYRSGKTLDFNKQYPDFLTQEEVKRILHA